MVIRSVPAVPSMAMPPLGLVRLTIGDASSWARRIMSAAEQPVRLIGVPAASE
jgi:hypothetical protein